MFPAQQGNEPLVPLLAPHWGVSESTAEHPFLVARMNCRPWRRQLCRSRSRDPYFLLSPNPKQGSAMGRAPSKDAARSQPPTHPPYFLSARRRQQLPRRSQLWGPHMYHHPRTPDHLRTLGHWGQHYGDGPRLLRPVPAPCRQLQLREQQVGPLCVERRGLPPGAHLPTWALALNDV